MNSLLLLIFFFFFFFNDTATTEIYTLSLHDALPISRPCSLTERVASHDRVPQPRRAHIRDRSSSGRSMPITYVAPMARATGKDPLPPDRTATPTNTGAQQALAIPENTPSA